MPTASTTQPVGQPARPDQPPPAAAPVKETDKPDADRAEPDPHERPPVRSDDN
jgi:hypothetical protein